MNRIKRDHLELIDGEFQLEGARFDGIVYELEDGHVSSHYVVKDGTRQAPAEAADDVLRVDASFLEHKDETDPCLYWNGDPFVGLALEFDARSGALISEYEYSNEGNSGHGRTWFPSGVLETEDGRLRPDGARESETWFESGQRRWLRCPKMSAGFTKAGSLRTLTLYPGGGEDFGRITLEVDGTILNLSGEGIDDGVLARLSNLQEVKKLQLSGTSVTALGIEVLQGCAQLESLDTARNKELASEDIAKLVARLPKCQWLDRDAALARLAKAKEAKS